MKSCSYPEEDLRTDQVISSLSHSTVIKIMMALQKESQPGCHRSWVQILAPVPMAGWSWVR